MNTSSDHDGQQTDNDDAANCDDSMASHDSNNHENDVDSSNLPLNLVSSQLIGGGVGSSDLKSSLIIKKEILIKDEIDDHEHQSIDVGGDGDNSQ